MSCSILVTGVPRILVKVLTANASSVHDVLTFFDGRSVSNATLATVAGSTASNTSFTSSSGAMLITFSSGTVAGSSTGFALSLSTPPYAYVLDSCPGPGSVLLADGFTTLSLTSRAVYPNSANCSVTISTPPGSSLPVTIYFTVFSTEAGADFVTLFDGAAATGTPIARLSGTPITSAGVSSFTSTSPSMTLQFTSDIANVSLGFTASIVWTSTYYMASSCPGPTYVYLGASWLACSGSSSSSGAWL